MKKASFNVYLNGEEVLRPISLPHYDPRKLRDLQNRKLLTERDLGFELRCIRSKSGAAVEYEGYLVTQAAQLFPEELRGILVRIRGVAISWHRMLYLPSSAPSTIRSNISGELWVDGLEDALQFDRESFREDHPLFEQFSQEISEILNDVGIKARQRSRKSANVRQKAKTTATAKPKEGEPPPKSEEVESSSIKPIQTPTQATSPQLLPSDLYEGERPYLKRIAVQVNGCWNHEYLEACATMMRRLLETLIIELYDTSGWLKDLKDPQTNDFVTLKNMVKKLTGDSRFGLDSRVTKGLNSLKELGDIAAHDFRILVRTNDIITKRDDLRYAVERLLFQIQRSREKLGK